MSIFSAGLDYFVKGGPVMYPLLFCSLAAIAISVERYLFFRAKDSGRKFTREFCDYIERDDWTNAKQLADSTQGELAKLATIVMARHGNFERLESFVNVRAERAMDKFEQHINYLNVIVTLAPVLGLLGTVTGMIGSFNSFSQRLDNPLAVTAGIGEALITTVFGLCISIVAVCMYAYFMRRLKAISLNVEEIGNTLLEAIAKNLDRKRAVAHGHPQPKGATV